MRAITNGEGEEEEVVTSAGVASAWGGNGDEPKSAALSELVLQKPREPVGQAACCDMIRMLSLAVPLCGAPRRSLLLQPRPRDDLLHPL